VFTDVPETYNAYYRQRKRWSRRLIEAFKAHPELLVKPRLNTPFIYFNVLFPYIDAAFLFGFLPGVMLALFFDYDAIVSIMTLYLLPLAMLINLIMFLK
jgi:biofilm PGA synthesis N-glycosyltransferase PgaC